MAGDTFFIGRLGGRRGELSDTETEEAIRLVQGEYLELPTLQLTFEQIQRLWNLEAATAKIVVRTLCDRRFLRQTPAGPYVRAASPARRMTPTTDRVA